MVEVYDMYALQGGSIIHIVNVVDPKLVQMGKKWTNSNSVTKATPLVGVHQWRQMGDSIPSSTTGGRRRLAFLRGHRGESENDGPLRVCCYSEVCPLWTSWTKLNPRRRFYGCRNYRQGGAYGYFHWLNDEIGEMPVEVINDLLGHVDRLYEENVRLRNRGEETEIGLIIAKMKKNERRLKFAMAALVATWIFIFVYNLYC